MGKILTYTKVKEKLTKRTSTKFLFTGVFDTLHTGHVRCLEYCYKITMMIPNSILIVAVLDDSSVRRYKSPVDGIVRPFHHEKFRAEMVVEIPFVDFVIINIDDRDGAVPYSKLVKLVKPDYWIMPEGRLTPEKWNLLKQCCITPIVIPRIEVATEDRKEMISTTSILHSLATTP